MGSKENNKEQRNTQLVRNMVGWLNEGDYEPYLENLTDDFFWKADALHPFPNQVVGKLEAAQWLGKAPEVLPGFHFDIEQVFPSGDAVIVAGTAHGHGFDGFMGLPAADLPWKHQYCLIYYLTEEGKVRGLWYFYDGTILLKRLGQVPDVSFFGLPPKMDWPPWRGRGGPERTAPAGLQSPTPMASELPLSNPSPAASKDSDPLTQMILGMVRFPAGLLQWSARMLGGNHRSGY